MQALIAPRLGKAFRTFYGPQRFIFAFYKSPTLGTVLSQLNPIQTESVTSAFLLFIYLIPDLHLRFSSKYSQRIYVPFYSYKVVQIWPGQTVTCLHTNRPGHIWTTLYYVPRPIYFSWFYYPSNIIWRLHTSPVTSTSRQTFPSHIIFVNLSFF